MVLCTLVVVVPLLMVLLGSFKTSAEAIVPSLKLPENFLFSNYTHVFEKGKIGRAMINSVFMTVVVVIICLGSSALCSFIISRRNCIYTKALNVLFKLGMIAPMSIIPTILLLQNLNIMGTYLGAILVYIAINLPWSMFIYTSFMKSIPRELEEAAIIDGCGPFRMFTSIVFPLLKNVTITNVVVVAMGVWNDFTLPLYLFGSSKKWTLPMSVYNFYGLYSRDWNYVFADIVITALPMILLYFIAQKHIVDGLTAGSVKG